jgi:hypothetical protein
MSQQLSINAFAQKSAQVSGLNSLFITTGCVYVYNVIIVGEEIGNKPLHNEQCFETKQKYSRDIISFRQLFVHLQ